MFPGRVHVKFHNSGCIPLSTFPRNGHNMALLWPKDGPHMILLIGSSWIIINVSRAAPYQIWKFWVYPVSLFSRNDRTLAFLWPKYGPYMVLQIGSSWILIIVPRDVLCQISYCWVYPVAPFPRNGQIWPFMAKAWSSPGPSNWFFLNLYQYAQGWFMPNFTLLGLSCSPPS